MILVTGGTGLVGSHLLYYLTQQEHLVRAIYRSEKKIDTVKHVFSYYTKDVDSQFSKIEWVKATLNDIPKLSNAFKNVTRVYHCAALVSFDPNDYHTLRKVNIEGTANIVNLCITNNIKKLCYVSSIATIGNDTLDTLTENTSWNPEADQNVYAITKYGAELEVWRGTQEGLDAVIVNPGIIIGPGYWNSSSGRLFKRIYKGLKYYTNGSTGYVDIDDVIQPMLLLMKSTIKNERYILVSEHITFKVFAQELANALHVKSPKKEASKLMLNIAWRFDWLAHFFTRKYRRLTRQSVVSLTSNSYYSNEKIKKDLKYTFQPVTDSILKVSQFFLKDHSSH